jgi:hypothetical protein
MVNLKSLFIRFDRFGVPVTLNYKNRTRFQTITGSALTLVWGLIIFFSVLKP